MKNLHRLSLYLIVVIVVLDLITKQLAIHLLPFEEEVFLVDDRISLYLTYNFGSSGSQADYMMENEANKNLHILYLSIWSTLLTVYILFVYRKKVRNIYKWLGGIALLLIISVIFELYKSNLAAVEIPNWITSVISKIAVIGLYLTIHLTVKDKGLKIFTAVIVGAGLGNLLSHFYDPYYVIDFVNVEGAYDLLRIGIFNIADLAAEVGAVGLVVSLLALLVRKILGSRSLVTANYAEK